IGALQAGCEAHDQQTRIEAAERGDRRVEPGRILGAPRFAKRSKPRAARAVAHRLAAGPCHSAQSRKVDTGFRIRSRANQKRYSKDSSSSSAPTGTLDRKSTRLNSSHT